VYILTPYFLMPILILSSHLYLGLPSNVFLSGSPPTMSQRMKSREPNPSHLPSAVTLPFPSFPLQSSRHSVGSDSLQQQLQLTHKWRVKQGSILEGSIKVEGRHSEGCFMQLLNFLCGLCIFSGYHNWRKVVSCSVCFTLSGYCNTTCIGDSRKTQNYSSV
jgi:hypothetical protein